MSLTWGGPAGTPPPGDRIRSLAEIGRDVWHAWRRRRQAATRRSPHDLAPARSTEREEVAA